jgi:Twin arginine targeting (Tat) protein translocase TatC
LKLFKRKEIKTENDELGEVEMTFLDHLEEFRWRLIYSIIGVVVGTILCWIFIDFLMDGVLLLPAKKTGLALQNLRPFGQIMIYMQVAIAGGIIISIPNLFYQIWAFVSPALRKKERDYVISVVAFSTICFLIGIVFAYFVMLPMTFQFAAQFGTTTIKNQFDIDEYFSIIFSVLLGSGLVFELPMISFFLSKIGILKPQYMRKFRRHAIVVIFVASAFLTPGTDPVSQIILAVPLVLLYEISIFISKISQKKN